MLRRLLRRLFVARPHLSIRPKSTAAAVESPQAHEVGGEGLFRSVRTFLRSGGREDLSAIGIGVGGLAVGASAICYIVGSVQSSHEKISNLTKDLEKERELRAKDAVLLTEGILKERELRAKDAVLLTGGILKERELREKDARLLTEGILKERELRAKDIEKERELREKDAGIMRFERAVRESELRVAKLELENARGK